MATVYKYRLQRGRNELNLPSDSVALSIDVQNNEIMMWVLHNRNPEVTQVFPRVFHVVITGEYFDIGYTNFIGTALQYNGGYVSHVFEQLDLT